MVALKGEVFMRVSLWSKKTQEAMMRAEKESVQAALRAEAEAARKKHWDVVMKRAGKELREIFAQRLQGELACRFGIWHTNCRTLRDTWMNCQSLF